MKRCLTLLMLCCVSVVANADFMCPSTYKYINVGDNEGQVLASCGEPVSKNKKEEILAENMSLETLVFTLNDARYELTFTDNRLIRIKSPQGDIESLDACRGEPVRKGASIYDVTSFCGEPVNRFSGKVTSEPSKVKAEEWFYRFGTKQVTLHFIEGALHDIKSVSQPN